MSKRKHRRTKQKDFSQVSESNLCSELWERNRETTPDYLDRKLEGVVPVFVYGTLKTGGFFHDLMKGAPFLGDAMTFQDKYCMKETDSFPVVFEMKTVTNADKDIRGKVFGEVFMVDPRRLLELDRLEHNGTMYKRKQEWIKMLDQGSMNPSILAWVYLAVPDYWDGYPLTSVRGKEGSKGYIYEWGRRLYE